MNMIERVVAGAKRAPKKTPPKEVINAGKIEQEGLKGLKQFLGYATHSIDEQVKELEDRIKWNIANDMEEKEAKEKGLSHVFIGEVFKDIGRGVGSLKSALEKIENVTGEKDLTKAVETYYEEIDDFMDEWIEDEKALGSARTLLVQALDSVPAALTGPGALTQLQQCFDLIAKACAEISKGKLKVPKIPKALEPEDPRQLGFGFTARVVARFKASR